MTNTVGAIELDDSRLLVWREYGAPSGEPAFMFHGTPGTGREFEQFSAIAVEREVRIIAPDRPGYGRSTFHKGRTLLDWADDVATIADHLGIDQFAVAGVSGGGPHAVACAAALTDRVTSLSTISGVGPRSPGHKEENVKAMNKVMAAIGLRSPTALRALLTPMIAVSKRAPERAYDAFANTAPPPDQEVLARQEFREASIADLKIASSTVAGATAQDMNLVSLPWGFELDAVKAPTHIWQGSEDINVAPEDARRMASMISHSTLHELEGLGHLLVVDHMPEILAALISDHS